VTIAGRKPKPPGQAVNRHATLEFHEVPNVPFTKPPKLPGRANGKPWSAQCLRKWRAWSRMPHCVLWDDADWEFAFDSMEVAATVLANAFDPRRAAELRNREKVMGTTLDFRRDIRVRYVEPKTQMAKVVGIEDYQDL
jgi:hypothetical protein